MLIPMFGWALTGLVFFTKPGYEGAYEILTLKTYPLEQGLLIPDETLWQEARLLTSIAGTHLLVKSAGQSKHLNALTLEEMPVPEQVQLKRIFDDAISHNVMRYGTITNIESTTTHIKAYTTNDIELVLDWNELKFSQKGFDRELINLLYKVHYLQWTPWPIANQILGVLGLFFLITLSVLGLKIYLTNRN